MQDKTEGAVRTPSTLLILKIFKRKQYTSEIFSPVILVFHKDSKYVALEIDR